ncbi:hypothetical protein [Methanococcus maripaludis]|uniref:Uncharacterized protein n=1 Tax=Methanococcus maripaludis OS7 TaxID=637915 RepID=A0A2Z5PJR9_METMI|nr:hypothetical protein [Methanococcus maripaludis]BAP62125.1 hypothetical protein MMOS7_00390 [Methanococcus maripaludis OS7]
MRMMEVKSEVDFKFTESQEKLFALLFVSGLVGMIIGYVISFEIEVIGFFLMVATLLLVFLIKFQMNRMYDKYISSLPYANKMIHMLFVNGDLKEECYLIIDSLEAENRYFRKIYSMMEQGYLPVEVELIDDWVE